MLNKNYLKNASRLTCWVCTLLVLLGLWTTNSFGQITVSGTAGGTLDGTYATFTGAGALPNAGGGVFAALNSVAQTTAVITVSITGDISTEPGTNSLNGGTWTSITVTPSGARTVSGGVAGIMINFNGADNVIIDGLNTGGNSLIIENTTAGASSVTIRYIADACNNTLQNTTIKGATTGAALGTVFYSTGITTGNIGNTITNCTVTASGANLPQNCIFSSGTSLAIPNTVTCTNNFISDFAVTSANISNGIHLSATGNTAWTITGNRVFQTASRVGGSAIHTAIRVLTGNGYSINNNIIGFATSTGTGVWTVTAGNAYRFIGIELAALTTTASNIQGNTISGVSMASTSGATTSPGIFCGITVTAGNVNVGTTSANTIGGSSGTGLITINEVTTGGGLVLGINTASTSTVSISNNVIGGIAVTGATAGLTLSFTGIQNTASATSVTISSNTVGNATANNITVGTSGTTTASTVVKGIYNSVSPTAFSATSNTVQNIGAYGANTSSTFRGIESASSSTPNTITGNTITNISSASLNTSFTSGGLAAIGIYLGTSGGSVSSITGNTISNMSLTNTTTTGTNLAGISYTFPTTSITITKNKIFGLSNASTSTSTTTPGTAAGIFVRDGDAVPTSINNNMISLGNGQTGNTSFIGIWLQYVSSSTTTMKIYHNSINIEGAVSSGAQPSFGLYRGDFSSSAVTVYTVDAKNNIFSNTRSGGTGKHYAIANNYGATASATGWGTNASNYNVLNGTAANIGYWTTDKTFATWKTASASDANSYSGITVNFTNTATGDLHLNMGVTATILESHGVAGLGLTDDYDSQVRPGPAGSVNGGASAPDLGADEFDGVPLDDVLPVISYTVLGNAPVAGTRSFTNVTVTDASGVNGTSGTRPRVYYKKSSDATNAFNSNTSATAGWKYAEANGSASPFDFTIDYSLLSGGTGVTTGDVIQYFVVAQDLATIPNVGINSGTFTGTPANVSLTGNFPIGGTINTYTITGTVSGTKTVCASGCDYTSLTNAGGAFATLNISTVTGNVNLEIAGNLTGETGANALNEFASPFTLTIYPTTSPRTVSGSLSSNALIKLNGADRVTINGSIGGIGTDQSLTISNTATTAPSVISIISLGVGSGATNNTIKNCLLSTGVATSTGYGIAVGASTPGAAGADNDNVTIQNNSITAAPIGIFASGTAAVTSGGDDNLAITGNTVDYNSTLTSLGIQVGNALNSSISQNTVSLQTSTTQSPTGISLETGFVSSSVTRNNITKALTTNTGGYGGRGITVGTGTALSALTIANNFISGVNGSNFSSFTNSSAMGICIGTIGNSSTLTTTAGGINLYYNSVNINGTFSSSTACITTALYIGTGATALDIRNNILVNTLNNTGTGTTSKAYSIYSAAANTAFTTINYNDYYVSGTQGVLGFLTSDRTNLAGIQAGFGQNAQSQNIAPVFTSNSDLHLPGSSNIALNDLGTFIGAVTVDYDGATRSLTTPDMGADEFTPPVGVDMGATALVAPVAGGCYTATETVTVTIKNYSVTTMDFSVNNVTVSVTATGGYSSSTVVNTGTLASNSTLNVTMPATINMTSPGSYTFNASTSVSGDVTAGNDAMSPVVRTTGLSGNYNIPGNYATLTAAVADYNTKTLCGAVTFTLAAGYTSGSETFPIVIGVNAGASATNTLTIKPATTATISGTVSSDALIKLNGADYITIDGSNSGGTDQSLTITNTNTSTSTGISVISLGTGLGATNNTIKNCNISTGTTSSTTSYGISVGGSTPGTTGADNDNVTLQNNSISVANVSIYANGTATVSAGGLDNLTITGNTIVSGNISNTSVVNLGIQAGNALTSSISLNSVSVSTAYSGQPVGISLETGFVSSTVSRNNITSVTTSATGGYGGRGITVGTGTATSNLTIANNFISGINGSNWTGFSNSSSMGIAIGMVGSSTTISTTAGGINIYYNSINMYGNYIGTSSTTGKITAALYVGTGASALDVRDNIFVNSMNNTTATASNYAIYSAAANTAFTSINYNDYSVSGAQGVLGFIGSDRTTLAAIQTGFGQNAQSQNIAPVFTSNSDLHLPGSSNIALNDLGTFIGVVTVDYDGATRSLTTPDMGADEFTPPVGIDMGATALVAPGASGCYTGTETVTVTIKNYSVTTMDFSVNNVTVSVTATGGYSSSTVVNTGTLASNGTLNVTMPATINMTAPGGYTFNASTSVAGDITPGNDAMSPVVRTNAALAAGTYSVGAGAIGGQVGHFATLTAAVAAYNAAGCMTGPVIFALTDATYSGSETFPISIAVNGSASATNTLTIKPNTGVTAAITGSVSSDALIKLNGADYVTIDGSNSGGTTQNLTITNTATTSPTAVSLISLGTGLGATNNTIKNCLLSTGVYAGNSYGIAVGGSTPGTTGADNDNTTLQNNTITVATFGIYALGTAAVSAGGLDNLAVTGNTITTNTTVATYGMQLGGALTSSVSQNTISVTTTASTAPVGISLETNFVSSSVTRNNITNVSTTATGGYGGRGIAIGTGTATSALTIANNFISGVNGPSWTSFSNSGSMGIAIGMVGNSSTITTTTGGLNIYYNSVNMYGTQPNGGYAGSSLTAAIYIGSGATTIDLRDNIFVNSQNNPNSSGTASKNYAIYSAAANTAFSNINYNDYYVSGTQGVLGNIGSTDRTNLAGIVTGFGSNAQSQNIAPVFTSSSDLHLPGVSNVSLDNLGTFIAAVTVDYDGITRSVTTPDMGADEFSAPACVTASGGTASGSTSFCSSGTPTITDAGYSTGGGSTYQWIFSTVLADYPNAGSPVGGQTNPASLTTGVVSTTTYYWLRVTCGTDVSTANSNMITVTVNPTQTASITPASPAVCPGGSITLAENGGTATSWLWSTSATTQSINVSPSSATTYTVTVTGTGGCTATTTKTVTINQGPSITSVTATPSSVCSGGSTALAATVNVAGAYCVPTITSNPGATGDYLNNFTFANITNNASGDAASDYTYYSALTANVVANGTTPYSISCGAGGSSSTFGQQFRIWIDFNQDGVFSASESVFNTTTYTWVGGPGANAAPATGSITIPNTAYNGVTRMRVLSNYGTTVSVNTAGCTHSGWGEYEDYNVSITGGTNIPAITYLWSESPASGTLTSTTTNPTSASNITTGETYTVVVTSSGCTASASTSVTINAPPIPDATTNAPVCAGFSLNLFGDNTALGQTSGNLYSWSGPNTFTSSAQNPSVSGSATTAMSGTYTLTVTNSTSCTASTTVSVIVNSNPVLSIASQTNVSCNGLSDGYVDLDATNGTAPFLFDLVGPSTPDGIFTGLAAGVYTATVNDDNGCAATPLTVTITEPPVVTANCSATPVSCFGGSNGTASVTAGGGTPGYTYLWSNTAVTASISGLSAGTYTVTVTDNNGCTATCTSVVGGPASAVSATCSATPVSCFGGSNGTASITAGGGTPGYTYLWSNAAITSSVSGLSAGIYTVTVTDNNGCTATCTSEVTEPSAVTATCSATPVSCNGGANGTASVLASGGTPGYSYLWSTTATTSSINGLSAGTYTVTVTDNNGCTATCTSVVTEPALAVSASCSATPVSCNGGANGTASVLASGGTPGYSYLWSTTATTSSISGLTAGTYTVTVTDNNGCTASCNSVVTEPALAVSASCSATPVSCNGGANGTASVLASGGTPGYSYLWSTTATTSSISGLTAGTYTVTVTDNNGCTATCTSVVTEPASAISISGTVTNVSTTGGNDGAVDITPSGGTPGYTYLWSNAAATQDISTLTAGTYTVTVTDNNGCTATASFTVTDPGCTAPDITCISNQSAGNGAGTCTAVVTYSPPTVTGTSPTVTYAFTGATTGSGSGSGSGSTFNEGTTTVTLTATNGCGTDNCSFNVVVTVNHASAPASVISDDTDNEICSGNSVLLTANGASLGTAGGSYKWYEGGCGTGSVLSSSSTLNVTPSVGSHTYYVRIEEPGCPFNTTCASITILVTNAPPGTVTGTFTGPSEACSGTVSLITVNPISGSNIHYSWNIGTNSSVVLFSTNIGGPFSPGPFSTLTNQVYAQFGALGGGQSGYYVCVQGVNACGSTNNRCLSIRGTVSGPGAITPANQVVACPGDVKSYACGTSAGASVYNWTLSGSATPITSGQGTQNVQVTFPPAFVSGQLCVTAALACGGSSTSPARCMSISKTPANPNVPTGAATVCPGATGVSYSIPAVSGATGYNWTVPANATIATGANSPSITVNFPTPYNGTSSVCVTTTSACGASAAKCKNVASGIPAQPAGITGPVANVCGSTVQYSVVNPIASSYTWTNPAGTTISGSATGSTILLNISSTFTSGVLTVAANSVACAPATSAVRTSSTIWGRPNNPGAITANPSVWCSGGFVNFYVTPASPLPSYTWTVSNGTIDAGQGTSIIDVTWGATAAGTVTVKASNTCGQSAGTSSQSFSAGCREEGSSTSAAAFSAYPNPAHDKITVSIDVKEQAQFNVKLLDMSGRVIFSEDHAAAAGVNAYELDLKAFAKGIYMLEVQSANDSWKSKVIIE